MSDSFADLWNATAPAKSTTAPPPRTLGASPSLTNGRPQPPKHDVFAALAGSKPTTPSYIQSGHNSPKPQLQNTSNTGSAPKSGDAFGDLFQSTLGGGSLASNGNMTMAQRAVQAERDKLKQMQGQQEARKVHAEAWAGLDSLGLGSSSARSQTTSQSQSTAEDDWLSRLGSDSSSARTAVAPPNDATEDWGLDEAFTSGVSARPTSSTHLNTIPSSSDKSQPRSLWDSDDAQAALSSSASRVRLDSPSNEFDFGSREDRLLGHDSDEDDRSSDILGVFSQSTETARQKQASICIILIGIATSAVASS
jgi:hypothetical protein